MNGQKYRVSVGPHSTQVVALREPVTWTCHLCGEERLDAQISVHTRDISAEMHLPPGHAQENVRFCNDRPACVEAAKTKRFLSVSPVS